jgi:hypothetical protein
VLHYIRLLKFANNKHSSLLDQLVSYEENEVLWIQPQEPTQVKYISIGKLRPYPQILD